MVPRSDVPSFLDRTTLQSIGSGIIYNLPHTNELASLDVEQTHNAISGPATIVTDGRSVDETHDGLRLSFQRYVRY